MADRKGPGNGLVWSTSPQPHWERDTAFAALKAERSAVTWGDARSGGGSRLVTGELPDTVIEVVSTGGASAGLKADGSVVKGSEELGGGAALCHSRDFYQARTVS